MRDEPRHSSTNESGPHCLVDGLLELLVVEDGPHLPVTVAGPVGCDDLNGGAAHVLSEEEQLHQCQEGRPSHLILLPAGVVDAGVPWEVRLAPGLVGGGLLLGQQLLEGSLQHVPPEPLLLAVGSHHTHRGLGCLLGLPVHPLDQSLVLVYKPVYGFSRIGLAGTATG